MPTSTQHILISTCNKVNFFKTTFTCNEVHLAGNFRNVTKYRYRRFKIVKVVHFSMLTSTQHIPTHMRGIVALWQCGGERTSECYLHTGCRVSFVLWSERRCASRMLVRAAWKVHRCETGPLLVGIRSGLAGRHCWTVCHAQCRHVTKYIYFVTLLE